ncbi:MAG: hypothetical protein ACOX9C_00010 [Kiritimatiellia bacterium]|jgi:drug/metabolite transporter (DMT)-like permease
MDFTPSLAFAIGGLVVVGASWCLIGAVLGRAPKEGFDASLITFTGALVSVAVGIVIELATGIQGPMSIKILLAALLVYLVAGSLNYIGLLAMSAGMQRGPNGVVWGISQSALVGPFTLGILFFGSDPTPGRIAGIACILLGLMFYARTKESGDARSTTSGPSWRFFSFFAFACFAIQQTLTTAPSYFEESRLVSPVLRSVASASGSLVCFAIMLARKARTEPIGARIAGQWRRGRFWAYVLSMQFFGLLFAYTLLYPGMDELARHGAGAISYPLMVASCIVTFTLYARLVLRERGDRNSLLALLFCLLGLALMIGVSAPSTDDLEPEKSSLGRIAPRSCHRHREGSFQMTAELQHPPRPPSPHRKIRGGLLADASTARSRRHSRRDRSASPNRTANRASSGG